MPRSSSTRGYSLVELAVVLGVISFVFAGIWTLSGVTGRQAKQEALIEQVSRLVKSVRFYFSGYADVPGGSCLTSCLTAQNLVPREMVRVASTDLNTCNSSCTTTAILDHPWGRNAVSATGGVVLAHGASAQTFTVAVNGLEIPDCAPVATRLASANAPTGLLSLSINGAVQTLPMTLKTALTACSSVSPTLPSLLATYRLRQ